MTPTELNKLPADQQQNALLAIALGVDIRIVTHCNPSKDKALMWDLACELGYSPNSNEQSLIAAYIAADPKGLIAKWRKENE